MVRYSFIMAVSDYELTNLKAKFKALKLKEMRKKKLCCCKVLFSFSVFTLAIKASESDVFKNNGLQF